MTADCPKVGCVAALGFRHERRFLAIERRYGKMPMKSRKSFLLRINPALYDALEAWSQQEMRSINGQIEYLLREAVKRRDRSFRDPDRVENDAAPRSAGDIADAPSCEDREGMGLG